MDLFSSTLTINQRLNSIKDKYKALFGLDKDYQNGKGKFTILKGNKKNYGNCVLIILPHVSKSGFLNAPYEKGVLVDTLKKYNIDKYVIMYTQPNKSKSISKKLIKSSKHLVDDIIEIVQPKFIIACDSSSADLFVNQKANLIELHGTIFTNYYSIPVILTYHLAYYVEHTGYEDTVYKDSIYTFDWEFIKTNYNLLIK